MKRALLALMVVAQSAHADSTIALTIPEKELAAALAAMPNHLEEPVGIVALARNPKLGLEQGDVVRLINGVVPTLWLDGYVGYPVVWLDVVRRGKPVAVRLSVKLDPVTITLERGQFREEVALLVRANADNDLRELEFAHATRAGKPSGIVLNSSWYNVKPLTFGDVVRKVDGVAVHTTDAFVAALDRAKDHRQVMIEIDRTGQAITTTIQLTDQPGRSDVEPAIIEGIARIKQLNDTCYEVPRSLIHEIADAVLAGPSVNGVDIVPSGKDRASNGFELRLVQMTRPSPLLAKLGLANGDLVKSVNGLDLWIHSQALEQLRKLITATHLTVVIERGGKQLTYVYLLM